MEIIKINYDNPDPEIIKKVAKVINDGKIAIVPGDAVYTVVCDAFNLNAVQKIYKIKRREKAKPFNLGLYCLEDIALYGRFNPLIKKIVKQYPQEPFTFVVPRKDSVPHFLNPDYKTLGFRIPFNKVTSTLSKFHRSPVIGTSANISELKNTYSVEELMDYFSEIFGSDIAPDIVLDAGKLPSRSPSTVLEVINYKVEIIRPGEIKSDLLQNGIKKLIEDYKKEIDQKL